MGDRFARVRSSLLRTVSKCGPRGVFSLKKQLQQYDRDESGALDRDELYAALSDFKLGVSEADVDAIFIELDEDDNGTVDFYELLQMIGPRLSHDRNAVVMQAFYKVQSELLNGDEAAAVDAKCFRDGYNAQHHPSVIDGLMAKEMAHIEFLDTFNDMFEVRSMVRAADFKGYYQLISAGISSDSEFIEMVGNCWGVTNPRSRGRRRSVGGRPRSPHRAWGSSPTRRDSRRRSPHRDHRRSSGAGAHLPPGVVEVEVSHGTEPGFQLSDDLSVKKIDDGSECELAKVHKGMILKAFQEEPVEESESGTVMMRMIRAEPLPWRFAFGPAGVPWSTDTSLRVALGPDESFKVAWGAAGQMDAAVAREEGLSVEQIMAKVKRILEQRGAHGIAGLGKSFQIMDDDASGDLNRAEFTKAMNDYKMGLNEDEIDAIFYEYDYDNSDAISYEEFVRALRGKMNIKRKDIVHKAFAKFDSDGSGEVSVDDLLNSGFDAKTHPDVKAGRKTERQVSMEMLERFDSGGDGIVSLEEFEDYYARMVSPSIDHDDHFVLLVQKAWGLEGALSSKPNQWQAMKGQSGENPLTGRNLSEEMAQQRRQALAESDLDTDSTLKRLREAPQLKGPRNEAALKTHFSAYDRDKSGDLSMEEFQRAMREFGVRLSNGEVRHIFMLFDNDKSDAIAYEEFLEGLTGGAAFSTERQAVVKEAFAKFDYNDTLTCPLAEMQDAYNTAAHPDVKSGKKKSFQVLAEFKEAVDPETSGTVTLALFRKYFKELSRDIADDEYFDGFVRNAFDLGGADRRMAARHDTGGDDDYRSDRATGYTAAERERERELLRQRELQRELQREREAASQSFSERDKLSTTIRSRSRSPSRASASRQHGEWRGGAERRSPRGRTSPRREDYDRSRRGRSRSPTRSAAGGRRGGYRSPQRGGAAKSPWRSRPF